MTQFDPNRLNAFLGQMLGDLGGAFSLPLMQVPTHTRPWPLLHGQRGFSTRVIAETVCDLEAVLAGIIEVDV